MQVLDRVQNLIGTHWGVGVTPTPGSKTVTVMADMSPTEIADRSNWLRLQVWADFGAGPRFMGRSPDWQGGASAAVLPSLTWSFDPTHPPQLVYGVLENGIRGAGSPAIAGLTLAFA